MDSRSRAVGDVAIQIDHFNRVPPHAQAFDQVFVRALQLGSNLRRRCILDRTGQIFDILRRCNDLNFIFDSIPLDTGEMSISDDGRLVFVSTNPGIRMITTPVFDCNDNTVDDIIDIMERTSFDCNHTGR